MCWLKKQPKMTQM